MAENNKNYHFTLQDHQTIQTGIQNGSKKTHIASILRKDKSTVGKEIKKHIKLTHKNTYPTDCVYFPKCSSKKSCSPESCVNYSPFKYFRRDRSPGACNRCSKYTHCRYDKYFYYADEAHKEYKSTLVDSRIGVNLTYSQTKELGDAIKPLIDQGHSPYQIVTCHPEFDICERTLYNYIDRNIFQM